MTVDMAAPGNESPASVYKEIMKYYDRLCRARIPDYTQSVDNWCFDYIIKRLDQDQIKYQVVEHGKITSEIKFFTGERRKR